MIKFFSFVKIQLLGMFSVLSNAKYKKKTKKAYEIGFGGFVAVLICSAICFSVYIYSKMLMGILIPLGQAEKALTIMTFLSVFVCFLLAFSTMGNLLFGFKDYDLLSSMPVSSFTVVLGKIFSVYLFDLLFTVLLTVPCAIVYSSSYPMGTGACVSFAVMTLFTPMVSVALSLLVGFIVSAISSKFKRANVIQTVFLMVFLIGVLAVAIFIRDLIPYLINVYPLTWIFLRGLNEPVYCLIYCAISFALALVITIIVSVFFKSINTFLNTKKSSKNFVLKEQKIKGQTKSLLKREFYNLFSNSTYTVNALFSAFMGLIFAVGMIIVKFTLKDVPDISSVIYILPFFLPALLCFTFFVYPSTVASVSSEGSAFWQLKTIPVDPKKIIGAKITVGLILYLPVAFLGSLAVCIAYPIPVLESFLLCFGACAISVVAVFTAMYLNMIYPNLDWQNKSQAVKNGKASLVLVAIAFVLATLFGVGGYFLSAVNGGMIILFAITDAVMISLFTAVYILLTKKTERFIEIGE